MTGRPRALLSASPEPFLAVDPDGHVTSDEDLELRVNLGKEPS